MDRRKFLNLGLLASVGGIVTVPALSKETVINLGSARGKVKNIIFMVSDGMSNGTLTMSDLFLRRQGKTGSNWLNLYREKKASRALVDTAAANSLVTDSAAGASAWGCGIRVNNGALNVTPQGTTPKPIMQKFKSIGKSTGLVTSVTITHATPAGFSVNMKNRGSEEDIATAYFDQQFDVLLGGGTEFFAADKRKDKRDLFSDFAQKGYTIAKNREEMENAKIGKPLLGIFCEASLPYALDYQSDSEVQKKIPSLASMAAKAIDVLSTNRNGFLLQIEGGKVDWAAHANDAPALIYDQVAFDEAIKVAVDFAEKDKETLVIITSDHGNANPGLIKSINTDKGFDTFLNVTQTNDWVLFGIKKSDSEQVVIDRIQQAQGIVLKNSQAAEILSHYADLSNDGLYNSYKLPFRKLAEIQQTYTSIGWSGMDHSADYCELAMVGPGSEALPPIVKNTDLHAFMLNAAGLK
jgi:alkaline phosphatase